MYNNSNEQPKQEPLQPPFEGEPQPPVQPYQPIPQLQQAQPYPYTQQPMPQQPQVMPPPYPSVQQQPMPPMQPQQMMPQPMMPQQPYMPYAPVNNNVNVNVQMGSSGPGFLVRLIYFCFVGWWLGYAWLSVGFFLCALVVTLPVGLVMLNRLPQIMTLKAAGKQTSVNVSTSTMMQNGMMMNTTNVNVNIGGTQQLNFFVRAVYFVFVGCWVAYLWANLAYLCCATIVLLPVGMMMFEKLPAILTLRKN